MRIVEVLKVRKYLLAAALAAVGIGLVLPLVQTRFLLNNLDIWFLTLVQQPLNAALYIVFSVVFGLLVALQLWNRDFCTDCVVGSKRLYDTKQASATGAFGALMGFVLGVCPACIGLIGLIAPLSVSVALTAYSWALTGLAIVIMLLSIHLSGGFAKVARRT